MTAQHAREGVRGTIPLDELAGGMDIYLTLASGQSYRWRCVDGDLFTPPTSRPSPWYETVADGNVVRIREHATHLEWYGTDDIEPIVRRLLRLDDDLDAILREGPDDAIYREAIDTHRGMRLVVDSLYVGLMSFICSTNMRVDRIHRMVQSLMATFGDEHVLDGRVAYAFPRPEQLAAADEDALRECGLGYRAPYIKETAVAIASGEHPLPDPTGPYETVREQLTAYHGVGPKVADCALLFGAGRLEPVPLDRWIERAIEQYFPTCAKASYAETSRAIRDRFGAYPGYTQTYLFHHLRTTSGTPP